MTSIPILNGVIIHIASALAALNFIGQLRLHSFDLIFGLYVIFALFSNIWAINTAYSFAASALQTGVFLGYISFRCYFQKYQSAGFAFVRAVIGFCVIIISLHFFWYNNDHIWDLLNGQLNIHAITKQMNSMVGTKNMVARLLVLCLPFLLGAMSAQQKLRWFQYLALGLVAAVLLSTGSRTAFLGIVIIGLIGLVYYGSSIWQQKKKISAIAALIVSLVIIIGPQRVWGKIFHQSLGSRSRVWSTTVDMFCDNNLFTGIGIGQWSLFRNIYSYSKELHPHNDVLGVLAELGLVGLLLFLVVWIGMVVYSFQNTTKSENNTALLFFAAVVAAFFMMMFDDIRGKYNHSLILMSAWAWIISSQKNGFFSRRISGIYRSLLYSMSLITVLYSAIFQYNHRLAEYSKEFRDQQDWQTYESILNQVDQKFYNRMGSWPILMLQANAAKKLEIDDNIKDYWEETLNIYPTNLHANQSLGLYYHRKKDYDSALPYLQQTQRSDLCNKHVVQILNRKNLPNEYIEWKEEIAMNIYHCDRILEKKRTR